MKVTFFALVVVIAALPAHAQQLDTRWSPWLGCWQLSGESVRVCVTPSADASGVTMSTYVDSAPAALRRPAAPRDPVAGGPEASSPALEQRLTADGAQHPIAEAECRGWQQTEWSRSGERLFARAELTCGDTTARKVTGVSMIVGSRTWIDIQGIEIAGRENVRVRRYVRAANQRGVLSPSSGAAVAPRLGATPFTIADVKEASGRISPRVLEAALVETNAGFDLSSRALIDLDRAGVADNVIDTMVALSYPRHFIVDRPGTQTLTTFGGFDPDDTWFGSSPFYPYYQSDWNSLYSPYFYAPFGYAYWAGYGGYYPYGGYFPGTGFVTINVDEPANGQTGGGRVINGVGYTRIRTRAEAEQESGGRQTRDTGSSGTSPVSSSGSSGSSGGSSGVSSSGFSSGSSSGDTGRTAQPR